MLTTFVSTLYLAAVAPAVTAAKADSVLSWLMDPSNSRITSRALAQGAAEGDRPAAEPPAKPKTPADPPQPKSPEPAQPKTPSQSNSGSTPTPMAGASPASPAKPTPPPSIDALIEQAALSDPAVKLAEAEVQMALAKLEAARQSAVKRIQDLQLKVATHRNLIARLESQIRKTEKERALVISEHERLVITGAVSHNDKDYKNQIISFNQQLDKFNIELEDTIMQLKISDMQLNAILSKPSMNSGISTPRLGGSKPEVVVVPADVPTTTDHEKSVHNAEQPPKRMPTIEPIISGSFISGSYQDKLFQALKQEINYKFDDVTLRTVIDRLITASKFTGIIRLTEDLKSGTFEKSWKFSTPETKMNLYSWLELILDELNHVVDNEVRLDIFVREYGLTFSSKRDMPPDAITLKQFWQHYQKANSKP